MVIQTWSTMKAAIIFTCVHFYITTDPYKNILSFDVLKDYQKCSINLSNLTLHFWEKKEQREYWIKLDKCYSYN